MTSKEFLNSVQRLIWFIGILVITCPVARVRTQDKPRLRDFGSSLKKHSQKNPAESQTTNVDDDVVQVRTDLVVCDVMVVNNQGKAILGLGRSDFVVSEDGKLQEVGTFSLGDEQTIPRSIVLILDYSSSQLPYIRTSVDAAKKLVDKLGPADRMALVTDDVKLLVDFTHDKALLKETLESLRKHALSNHFGKSLQYSALMATLNEMFSAEDTRPIIIFQTDGDQLAILSGFTFKDVTAAVERSRATIYTIIPDSLIGLSERDRTERTAGYVEDVANSSSGLDSLRSLSKQQIFALSNRRLKEHLAIAGLATLSGGWPDNLEEPYQADEVYGRILTDINNRYVIGYYPTNKTRNGKRRNIKIEVRGHPEYIVWGRKTYFAPEN